MAQDSLTAINAGAQLRDAAIDGQRGLIYLSAYDRNEVWVLDLNTSEQIASITVERGPSALALSADHGVLAVLNRLAESVSLIRAGETAPFATVPTGKGPAALTAMPGGGFAVANGFGDSVTIINTAQPEQPATLSVPGVPSAVAASEEHLAVGVSAPPSVLLFRAGAQTPESSVELPGRPVDLAAVRGGRFVAATKDGIYVIDASAGAIVKQMEQGADALAVNGDMLFAVSGNQLLALHSAGLFEAQPPVNLDTEAQAVANAGRIVVALSPAAQTWYRYGPSTATASEDAATEDRVTGRRAVPAGPATPRPRRMTEEGPAVVEAQPVEPEEPPAAAAEPAPEPAPQPTPEPTPPAQPKTMEAEQAEPVAPEVVEPEVEEAEVEPIEPANAPPPTVDETPEVEPDPAPRQANARPQAADQRYTTMRPNPLTLDRPRPPGTRRPQPVPLLGEEDGLSFSEGLASMRPLDATEGGFRLPDFTEDGNLDAEELSGDQETGLEAHGNVHFTIGVTEFTMDHFTYNQNTGEMHGWGNVVVTQEQATLTADDIYFVSIPAETEPAEETTEQQEAPLAAQEGYQEDASESVIGMIQGTNVHIIEPTREMKAEYLEYDFSTETGLAKAPTGRAGVFYFGADSIVMTGKNQVQAENVWITTCDCDHEYYRVHLGNVALSEDQAVTADDARLEVLGLPTPLYWPKWKVRGGKTPRFSLDFDSGRSADIGYYVNVGQRFAITPEVEAGVRLYPTTKAGVGFGLEGSYDYMKKPASPMFRSQGEVRSMVTTENSGHIEWYHRHEIGQNTVFLGQWEQWFEQDFVKEFYYDEYRDRTGPRTFGNVTYTRPRYLASATVRATTNEDVAETERLPEGTYSLFERRIAENLYVTYDAVVGYNEREPSGTHSGRLVNVGRATYDVEVGDWLNLTPYLEVQGNWYSDMLDGDSEAVFSNTIGLTAQTRFQRTFGGALGFSEFRHIVVPSITYSYKAETSGDVEDIPRFDALDNMFGQTRLEAKLDNLVFGRDAESGEVWQVARVSLYQGTDFWNELRDSEDYEIEIDIRPRPEWGFLLVGERHKTDDEIDLDEPFALQRGLLEIYERLFDEPIDPETAFRYNARFGDYDRLLTYLYYNDPDPNARWNGRLGYSYTETQDRVFNREVLYGLGYRLNDKWSVAFEHRYDFERDTLARQTYEIRRDFYCVDGTLAFSERESGWDVQLEIGITAFPGTKVKF